MINSLLLSTVLNSTLIFSGQAIDIASTQVALNRCQGCYESNPLMRSPAIAYPAKIGFALFGVAIAREIEKSGHKKTALAFSIGLFIVPSVIAYHNLKVSRRYSTGQ